MREPGRESGLYGAIARDREMMGTHLIGIVLLALILIPLIAVVGPQALGALAGAGVMLGVVRLTGRKQ